MHKTLKNKISLLLLALFISMKMIGLHVLAHDGDKDHLVHCALCEHAVMGNHYNPATLPCTQDYKIIQPQPVAANYPVDNYSFTFCDTFIANPLFSRPPPAKA